MVTMVTHPDVSDTYRVALFPPEFTRRWCSLNDGTFSYYENDKSSNPNGGVKTSEIVCVAVDPPDKHGYVHVNSPPTILFPLLLLCHPLPPFLLPHQVRAHL